MHLAYQNRQCMSKCSKRYSIVVPVELLLFKIYLSMLSLHMLYIVEWEDDSDSRSGVAVKGIEDTVSLFTILKLVKEKKIP